MKKTNVAQAVTMACGSTVRITSDVDDTRIGVWHPMHAEITDSKGNTTKEFSPQVMFNNDGSGGAVISGLKGSNDDGSFTGNDELITLALMTNRLKARIGLGSTL